MLNKFYVLLFISHLYFAIQVASEEDCVPLYVTNLKISHDFVISWDVHPDEVCNISHFVISVNIEEEQSSYTSEESRMDLHVLPTCVYAGIFVSAVSTDDEAGMVNMLLVDLPLPPEANLTLNYLRLEQQDVESFSLEWDISEEWRHCAKHFRVLAYNEDSDEVRDIYVETTSVVIDRTLPCEKYKLGVAAIYTEAVEGPTLTLRYLTSSLRLPAPELKKLTSGTTTAVLEWQLESYTRNRCPVSKIVVDASPYFKTTYSVQDTPDRSIITKISSLEADTIYFLNVTVFNTAGSSAPFLGAVQTLDNN